MNTKKLIKLRPKLGKVIIPFSVAEKINLKVDDYVTFYLSKKNHCVFLAKEDNSEGNNKLSINIENVDYCIKDNSLVDYITNLFETKDENFVYLKPKGVDEKGRLRLTL